MKVWYVVDTTGRKLGGPFNSEKEAIRNERRLGGYALNLGKRRKKAKTGK